MSAKRSIRSLRVRPSRWTMPVMAMLAACMLAAWVSLASAQTATTQPAATDQSVVPATQPHYPAAPPDARVTDLGWFAPHHKVVQTPRPEVVEQAYVVPVHEEISPKTFDAIRRKLTARPAVMVIFDLRTPGGRVDATEEITRFIYNDLNEVYTVAFVNPDAFSAGALIAMACSEIVMAPDGRIGAATPIIMGGGTQDMGDDVRAKMHSAMLAIAASVAEQRGYDPLLAKSMISREINIWLIRNRETMELRIIQPGDFRERVANLPPAMQTASAPAVAGDQDDTPWDFIRVIDGPETVLTMTAREAFTYGVSSATLPSSADDTYKSLKTHFNIQSVQTLGDTWSEKMVEFLTSPAVTGILAFILIIGVYAFTHTGSITSAIMIVISLAILLGARYLTGLALWWEILVLVVGLLLILLEIFVLPGFGVAGILGIVMVIVGLLLTITPHAGNVPWPRGNLAWDTFRTTLLAVCIAFIAATVAGYYLMRNLPKLPIGRRLALAMPPAAEGPPVVDVRLYESIKPGCEGVLESTCRPIGRVRIGDELFDAMSEGEMLERGEHVRVLRRDGSTLVVERSPKPS